MRKEPWVLRLPAGLRQNPGFTFIGFMCALSGFASLTGLSEPTAITQHMHTYAFKVWGGFLFISGVSLITACIRSVFVLERFALRVLNIALLVFGSWAIIAVGTRGLVTASLCLALISLSEVRVGAITVSLRAGGAND